MRGRKEHPAVAVYMRAPDLQEKPNHRGFPTGNPGGRRPCGRLLYRPVGTVADTLPRSNPMGEAHAVQVPARDRIVEAAERVVTDIGAARLTLDGVAQAAGVSKGGLLYHFP